MDSERAETYLRNLAESELRRCGGGGPEAVFEDTARVRAVAAAFTRTGALDPGRAEAITDDLLTALEIRMPGDREARSTAAHPRRAFLGYVEAEYPEGPCIWLRDDGGQWHVARVGAWSSGGVIVFGANVIPPVAPSVTAVDLLLISRTAEVRASVPLTWWTS